MALSLLVSSVLWKSCVLGQLSFVLVFLQGFSGSSKALEAHSADRKNGDVNHAHPRKNAPGIRDKRDEVSPYAQHHWQDIFGWNLEVLE